MAQRVAADVLNQIHSHSNLLRTLTAGFTAQAVKSIRSSTRSARSWPDRRNRQIPSFNVQNDLYFRLPVGQLRQEKWAKAMLGACSPRVTKGSSHRLACPHIPDGRPPWLTVKTIDTDLRGSFVSVRILRLESAVVGEVGLGRR